MSANATPSRLMQTNATGSATSLALKKFAGEILTAFETKRKAFGNQLIKTITNGYSHQFPATWKVDSAYHTPGNRLLGSQVLKHAERVINVDSQLIADTFIANWDEAVNHYETRSIYTDEIGIALANKADKQLLQLYILAARAAATVSGGYGGTALTNASYGTNATTLASGLFAARQTLEEKDVDTDGVRCYLKPAQYFLLAQNTTQINSDWGGLGAYSDGSVIRIAGIELVMTNNLPSTNLAQETGTNNTYHGDFTKTIAVVCKGNAVGTVKLRDLTMEAEYQMELQGTLMLAKYIMGHGILRPECSVELANP